jgi:peptide/nickel transport system substrate-binding protein
MPFYRPSRRAVLASAAALPFLHRMARAERAPGSLIFGLSTYPPNISPWVNSGTSSATVKLLIYRGLLSYSPDGKLRGELAESWARDGDTGWLFKLRDAKFSNGAPVTSADVKWTIEQVAAEKSTAYYRTEFQGVQEIVTPDPGTVRIVMKQPTVTLPVWLASFHMPIIAQGSTDNGGTPIGTGPFKLTGQERGVSLDFVASDTFYKRGLPKLKSIKMIVYADENLRAAALQSGDVDLIEYVPWQSMQAIEADPRLKLDGTDGPFMELLFNGKSPIFADPKIRLATAFAIRREEIVKTAFFGRGAVLEGLPIPPGSEFFDPARSKVWHYDPDRAKTLLKQAGKEGGFSCALLSTAQYGMHKMTAEVVQQHLGEIGIQVQLNLPDWPTRVAIGNRGQFEFAIQGTSLDSNDPDSMSQAIDGTLAASYGRSYDLPIPKLHELLVAGRGEFDLAKRKEIYAEVEKIALEQVPMVGLAWRKQAYAMAKDVTGFHNLPGALTFYSGVTLEETSIA